MRNTSAKEVDEYGIVQAAKLIGVSHTTIYNAVRDRKIKYRLRKSASAINGVALIKEADLLAFYEDLKATAHPMMGKGKNGRPPNDDAGH